jgi:hypothetical protein
MKKTRAVNNGINWKKAENLVKNLSFLVWLGLNIVGGGGGGGINGF